MGRPKMTVGSYGKIGVDHLGESVYRARANYRADDGVVRRMTRTADTAGRARRALEVALRDWAKTAEAPTVETTMGTLFDGWLEEVRASGLAPNSKQLYEHMVSRLRPRLAALTVREVTTGYLDRVLQEMSAS